jgi:hypothetical protein
MLKCHLNLAPKLFSGKFRRTVFPILYAYILLAFATTEAYIKVMAYKQQLRMSSRKVDLVTLAILVTFTSQASRRQGDQMSL